MMQAWGITGTLLILVVIVLIVYFIKAVVRSAINNSEFRKSVDNDLREIKEDINNIVEILKSKDK